MASVIPSAPLGTDAAAGRPQGLGAALGAGPDQATAEHRFRFELAAHPGSPAQARRLTRARLTGWSVCEDTCDTADLVISELVTNAIVHTASNVVVCELYDDGDDLLRIAVRDEGCAPGEPHPSPQRPEEEHGRGLLLVEALCHAWGAQEHGAGLLVWADLPRNGDGPRAHADPGEGLLVDVVELCADLGLEPRDDLGWGAPPKPGPPDASEDEDEPAEPAYQDDEPTERATAPAEGRATRPPLGDGTAAQGHDSDRRGPAPTPTSAPRFTSGLASRPASEPIPSDSGSDSDAGSGSGSDTGSGSDGGPVPQVGKQRDGHRHAGRHEQSDGPVHRAAHQSDGPTGRAAHVSEPPAPRTAHQPHRAPEAGAHAAHPVHRAPETGVHCAPDAATHPAARVPDPAPHALHRIPDPGPPHPTRPPHHTPESPATAPAAGQAAPRVAPQWRRAAEHDGRSAAGRPVGADAGDASVRRPFPGAAAGAEVPGIVPVERRWEWGRA